MGELKRGVGGGGALSRVVYFGDSIFVVNILKSVKVRFHTAIIQADFVSWCMLYTYEGNKIHS